MVQEYRRLLDMPASADPASTKDYAGYGGFSGFINACGMTDECMLEEMRRSGLLGRGGAGYPTWIKWDMVKKEEDPEKYVVCNLDEGEAGAFKDRELLLKAPLKIIEGMMIAARYLKAGRGYIYIRGEYRKDSRILKKALENCRNEGLLKQANPDAGFDITLIVGAGSYLCGEETALLESIEGRRPESRKRPPYPTQSGLFGKPTLINNAETFANIPAVFSEGAEEYSRHMTKLISISGAVKKRGVYEAELGAVTLHDLIYDDAFGGGTVSGKPAAFYQLGGGGAAMGFPEQIYTPMDYEALRETGLGIGCGALIVADADTDPVAYLKNTIDFFTDESCGRCVVCRNGLPCIKVLLERLAGQKNNTGVTDQIAEMADQISEMAGCGLGTAACSALKSFIKYRRGIMISMEKEGEWYE